MLISQNLFNEKFKYILIFQEKVLKKVNVK